MTPDRRPTGKSSFLARSEGWTPLECSWRGQLNVGFRPIAIDRESASLSKMIDFFRAWLPQIIGYAEIVVDGTLRSAWETGDKSRTSTYYSGELDEQVLGDLQAETMRVEMRSQLQSQPELVEAVDLFLSSITRLVEWAGRHVDTHSWGLGSAIPVNVSKIFGSREWRDTERHAAQLLAAAEAAGFSSGDFDPS